MQAIELVNNNTIALSPHAQLDPVKTFECGQCFRWNMDEDGIYTGVVLGSAAKVWVEDETVYIRSNAPKSLWEDYFDLDRDYDAIEFPYAGEFFESSRRFGQGIRILRQERWEALCSFIISQCNNIPRIKGIVERLCQNFGEAIEFEGEIFYSFPNPETIALLEPSDLAPIRSGYRADFIVGAARAVCNGFDLDYAASLSHEEAVKKLCELHGVGKKVANCVVLFGLNIMSGFPIDTWIKKALKEHFPPDFDPASFGEYAGIAQQYIFYYARSGQHEEV